MEVRLSQREFADHFIIFLQFIFINISSMGVTTHQEPRRAATPLRRIQLFGYNLSMRYLCYGYARVLWSMRQRQQPAAVPERQLMKEAKMSRMLQQLIVVSLLCIDASMAAGISCRDNNGQPIDWCAFVLSYRHCTVTCRTLDTTDLSTNFRKFCH